MNAVDTNIFVYTLDASEPVKQAKAQELLDHLVAKPAETRLVPCPWLCLGMVARHPFRNLQAKATTPD